MLSPFEWWCRNFILPDICKPCLFVFLRNLFYLTLAREGYLRIDEADDTYNDLNRKIINAYRERYGTAYLGRINYSGNQRQRIADGTESVFEAYTGQPLYNFCCDLCVSAPDRTLEELIRHWNNADVPLSEKKVDAIMDRIQVLCGQTFIWY